jgi:DNA repair exonuclease SbcCD ATPase subunit
VTGNDAARVDDLADIGATCQQRRTALQSQLDAIGPNLEKEISGIATATAAARKDLTERIANNRKALDDREAVEQALKELAELEAAIPLAREQQTILQTAQTSAEQKHRTLEAEVAAGQATVNDLGRARVDAGLIAVVPFGDKCADSGCQFVSSAVAARGRIPALEAAVVARDKLIERTKNMSDFVAGQREQLAVRAAGIAEMEAARTRLLDRTKNRDKVAAAEGRIGELQVQVDALDPAAVDARRRAEQMAETYRASLQQQVDSLAASEREQVAKADARHAARFGELQVQLVAAIGACDRLRADLAQAEADLSATAADSQQAQQIQATWPPRARSATPRSRPSPASEPKPTTCSASARPSP